MTLPADAQDRKDTPIFSGVLRYFPDAIAYVARVSKAGNDQHHPGTPLHWDKSKSTDEGDALVRHQLEAGLVDSDGIRHSGKVAWRALAQLQRELDADPGRALERAAEHDRAVAEKSLPMRTWTEAVLAAEGPRPRTIKKDDLDTLAKRYGPAPSSRPAGFPGDSNYANEVEGGADPAGRRDIQVDW